MIEAIIIGPGRMGTNYGRILKNDSRVKIIAICGKSLEKTLDLANELNCPAYPEENYKEAFNTFSSNSQRLVIIATSEWQHLDPLKVALENQSTIIIEKPILGSYHEFIELSKDILAHNKPILPCFTSRFDPRYFEAHSLVEKNSLKPLSIYSRRNTDFITASRVFGKINWPYWIVVHDIDLIRWFSNSEVVSVRASSRIKGKLDLKRDYLQIELELENGCMGYIESSWFLPPLRGPYSFSDFRYQSEDCLIELSSPGRIIHNDAEGYSEVFTDDFQDQNGRFVGNTPNMINHFLDVISYGRKPIVNINDGISALKVSEAILRSIKFDATIYLNEIL